MATSISDELLVENVRIFPCLWDTKCKAYKELRTKENAWKEVQKEFSGFTIEDLNKRWKAVRDKYVRETKKVKESKKSGGAGPPYEPGWSLFKILFFLNDSISHRPTHSNMPISLRESSSSSQPNSPFSPPISHRSTHSNTPISLRESSSSSQPNSPPPNCESEIDVFQEMSTSEQEVVDPLPSSLPPPHKRRKDELDELIYERFKGGRKNISEDDLFGRQMAANLSRLTPYQNASAKIRMQQVLFDVEFGSEDLSEQPNTSYYNFS